MHEIDMYSVGTLCALSEYSQYLCECVWVYVCVAV